MSSDKVKLILKYYGSWLALIWPAIAIYYFAPYYHNFLSDNGKKVLLDLALVYTFGAPAVYYWLHQGKREIQPSRAYKALCTLKRLAVGYRNYLRRMVSKGFYPAPEVSREEKANLLFMIVKLFFLPLMLNFLFANIDGVHRGVQSINSNGLHLNLQDFNRVLYPFILSLLLVIDTVYFAFGYAVESRLFNNKIVSVDPTFLGWFSCLICYPPFSGLTSNYLPWRANDYVAFHSAGLTTALYVLALALMFIYVAATVALGAKASNLTNRGVVAGWPYSFVRHPAYTSKNLAWWLTIIPIFSPTVALSMAGWSFIYFLRSVTEERHLMMSDNGYKEYAKAVRWRFIPGLL